MREALRAFWYTPRYVGPLGSIWRRALLLYEYILYIYGIKKFKEFKKFKENNFFKFRHRWDLKFYRI